jgi:plasmid stabilization system protein ParE
LQGISEYIREHNPVAARAVVAAVRQTASSLARFPYLGRRTDAAADVYVLPVAHYPYLIFYQVTGRTISIVHVRHTSRERNW